MTIPTLPALIEEVEKALEPFADAANQIESNRRDCDGIDSSVAICNLTVSDFRRASKALAALRAAAKEGL